MIEVEEQAEQTGTGINLKMYPSSEKMSKLYDLILLWCQRLRKATDLVAKKSTSKEPYKYIYEGLEEAKLLRQEILRCLEEEEEDELEYSAWLKCSLVPCYSCIAKWNEACDQLGEAEQEYRLCINLIDGVLALEETILPNDNTELKYGFRYMQYMLLYELTRYAILCSERDNQEKALELLKRAEEFYHSNCSQDLDTERSLKDWPLLKELESLNDEKPSGMFVYVLFYLGQAYQITDRKEMALLYLQKVLRTQLETKSTSTTTWASDTIKMAAAVLANVQSFQACSTLLVAATSVLTAATDDDKSSDHYKQTWADLGRGWIKLGLEILDASCDRLKDLEQQTRKPLKFKNKLEFTTFEKKSLELDEATPEFDTLLLINSFTFPILDLVETMKNEMPFRYARDFDEARGIFLHLQRWYRIAIEYYVIDEYAGDYIEIVTDYANSFKYLVFFEPNIKRQISMLKRRLTLLEDLLKSLNPVPYRDVFHYVLKDLADTYEDIYKLKVSRAKDTGESLQPKDKKLVKLLSQTINAHKRNLENFQFDIKNLTKNFPEPYEKALLGIVLSIGRILGSASHEHPLHPEAVQFAQDGKAYYEYFLAYLNGHASLKSDFKVLYDGALDMPQLLDRQIDRIELQLQRRRIQTMAL